MSTVILTPLFPPDPSDVALYAKLLSKQLQPTAVIAFGTLPESIDPVPVLTLSKRTNKLTRAVKAFMTLLRLRPTTLIVLNGPSSELPALWYSWLFRPTMVYVISDQAAVAKTGLLAIITHKLQRRVVVTVTARLPDALPPEWLPADEPTDSELEKHKTWWQTHLKLFAPHV